jgi:hypothetical protein
MDERALGGGKPDLTDVSNALLLAPADEPACLEFATEFPAERTRVLGVVYEETAQEWVDKWVDRAGGAPPRGGLVSVGQTDEDIKVGETDGAVSQVWSVRTVADPADLTSVGIEVSELLSTLAETAGESDHIVVCFDSVTALLRNATLEQAFRFFHVATGRVRSGGALGRYHLDPDAHDSQARATLEGLFDAVVEYDDGTWTVRESATHE